jgi:hypothetical protein
MIEASATHEMPDGTHMLHSSLTVVSSELTVFTGYKDLKMLANLCDWYDCAGTWIKRTRGKGVETVSGVWLNLIGATTPTTLQDALPQEAAEGGFMSRAIFVFSNARIKRISPIRIQTSDEVEYNNILRNSLLLGMHRMCALKGEFVTSRGFNFAFSDWCTGHCDKVPVLKDPRFKPYIGRRAAHVMKVSMVCSAARDSSMRLEEQDFTIALSYIEAVEQLMTQIFEGFGSSDIAMLQHQVHEFIKEHIVEYQNGLIPMAVVIEHFHNHMDNDIMQKVLATLTARGLIKYGKGTDNLWYAEVIK